MLHGCLLSTLIYICSTFLIHTVRINMQVSYGASHARTFFFVAEKLENNKLLVSFGRLVDVAGAFLSGYY